MRALLAILAFTISAFAAAAQTPPVIQTEASHAVILDYETGAVLFSKNGDAPMIPASMTKMMTAQVVFDRIQRGEISLEDRFITSERAWREGGWASGGSTMGLAIGDEPTVEELLRGIIILSGNDACIVLAEGLSGSEEAFAAEMTALAREMGLSSATFTNSTGLYHEDQRISAADLARLAAFQIGDFPDLYELYAVPEYEWRGISQPNRNPLLGGAFEGADGLKTGHLEASGYSLTASAVRDGVRRILVVNGMESQAARAQEARRLMRLAFTSFETRTIAADGETLGELDVWMGAKTQVAYRLGEPVTVSGHKRAFDDAKTEIVYQSPIEAPIQPGDQLGELIVTVPGSPVERAPIVAVERVNRLGFVGRAVEGLRFMMTGRDDAA
ncbi:MAG: D-alanyl-D-alanine carboxypeptidase family protein [Pseudomonadota bacterium]